ncbi:hypothetical protein BH11MYX3_BH11MYX3_15330 [soil metagenome]
MVAADYPHMTGIRFASPWPILAVLAASGCSVGSTPPPAYPQQMAWTGPPGGAIDQGYGYELPAEGDGSYEGSYPPGADDPDAQVEPSADPADPGYALGDVTDAEIDVTLEASGEWVEDPDYGRVWVPYATVVGEQFTPYDSSGDWVYTDYGWSFNSDYDWGWLAFHFGRWAMFGDERWGWVPDHTWGPSWCEWRHGEGTVGWRPMAPNVRDHRTGRGGRGGWTSSSSGPANGGARGHRDPDTTWQFAAQTEFGLRHRPTAFALGDGLRATTPVTRPPAGQLSGRASALMGGRLRGRAWTETHPTPVRVRPNVDTRFTGARPGRPWQGAGELGQSTGGGRPWMKPPSPWEGSRGTAAGTRTWQQPTRNTRTWQTPPRSDGTRWNGGAVRGGTYQPPANGGRTDQPQRPMWTAPRDRAPARPSWSQGSPSRPSYNPPARPSYHPPADRSPSRPSYNPPSRPASSWGGGSSGSFRAPSRPSYSSGSSGSYSPPRSSSPSSSSSGSSRSYSAPSSSSGSRSSSSSGSSRSSGSSSSGGGRRR